MAPPLGFGAGLILLGFRQQGTPCFAYSLSVCLTSMGERSFTSVKPNAKAAFVFFNQHVSRFDIT